MFKKVPKKLVFILLISVELKSNPMHLFDIPYEISLSNRLNNRNAKTRVKFFSK